MGRITDTVKHLLIINVLMWIATLTIGTNGQLFESLFALHFPKNDMFKPWQIITHMFMHASYYPAATGGMSIYFQHILFNMFALWMFGTPVEQMLGKKKFIFFYISAGIGAVILQLAFYYFNYYSGENLLISAGFTPDEINHAMITGELPREFSREIIYAKNKMLSVYYGSMVGASGAIMGVMVAFGMLFPESKLMLIFLPIPIKAKYFIPGIIALDLFSALTGMSVFSPDNTAYMAHIGGALFGFIMMWYWKKNSFNDKRWD